VVGGFPQSNKGWLPIGGYAPIKNDSEVEGFPSTRCWLNIFLEYRGCPPVKGWLIDVFWKKPISLLSWGGKPPVEGFCPKRLLSPPKNNGVKKGFPPVGGVEGYVLEGGNTMVGITCDTNVNVDVWFVAMFN
jgi:hypothetical protein